MLVTHALEDYAYHCRAKNLSAQTIRWYEHKLRLFAAWLGTQGITDLEDIKSTTIARFIGHVLYCPLLGI